MVKPERANVLEKMLIDAAQAGRIRGSSPSGQVNEADLVGLLEQLEDQETRGRARSIRYQRKQAFEDEDILD